MADQPVSGTGATPVDVATPMETRDIKTGGLSLRQFAARGTMINGAFTVGLSLLTLVRGFVLAVFLTRAEYGVWGLLVVSLGTVLWLKQVGIGDKYIQQDEADQELAFQKAFTLEALLTGIFMVLLAAGLPLFALLYGEWDIILPGLVILLMLPAGVLQTPAWAFSRNMEFLRVRLLQSIDPVVGFVVAVAMAIAGAGYWALAGGALAGAWASALAVIWQSPYRLRWRYDRGTMRQYFHFSWPLLVANASSLVIAQSATLAVQRVVGVGAVGSLSLTYTITSFTERVDQLVTGTLYPAICAVKDRIDLLEESFVKSNRLGLMWGVPFGCGLGLFASDLVTFAIGEEWRQAGQLMEVTGFNAAFAQVAFNWDAYMRALDRTRPIAVANFVSAAVFVLAGLPLIVIFELDGLAAAIVLQSAGHVVVRVYYLRQLFSGFRYLRQASRSVLPTLPAIAAVLIVRSLETGDRIFVEAAAEAVLFLGIVSVLTWRLERGLLREAVGYLSRPK